MSKTVLITGCSSGIGLETTKLCKKEGFKVFATARKREDLQRLTSFELEPIFLELTDIQSIHKAVEEFLQKSNGKIDILFNNAAYGQPGALEDLPLKALQEQFATNLFGWHALTQKIIPIMRKQGFGRIIHHSSILGLIALKYRGAYNASKFALEGYTDTLRLELQGSGIDVITLNTGPVISNFRKNALQKFLGYIDMQKSPHKRLYKEELKRMEGSKNPPFTLTSEEVAKIIVDIMQTPHPKPRYYITKASTVLVLFKRALPTSLLDKILQKI
ncbi:SDR family NAD(P)-dependent oxidoreductase [Nitratiruptor tergarcus]|uniref:Short-chain dehydrogenase n=1 Tax=Nitratiruptor tergarcus DSM 16512 TaxID=1069081 RepID=A0A1W1WR81_9BACT|nr:SDR family NAD(P)-dependent oxidoreductase [Nitratiruptor tergarcus]SMC08712.1 Short-chain dehydrogenase [Nitratiruptor tergarcus DSM 16512]